MREKFIAECLRALKKTEVADLSLRALSKKIGVSPMAAYRHFANKQDLLIAIAEEGFARLADEIAEAEKAHPSDPCAQLQDVGFRYVKLALQNREHIKVMFGGVILDHDVCLPLKEKSDRAFDGLVRVIVNGQNAKEFPAGDPVPMAVSAWSAVHGFSMLLSTGQLNFLEINESNFEPIARQLSRTVVEGLKIRKS